MQAGGDSASARSMRLGSWVIAKAADAIVDKGRRIASAMLETVKTIWARGSMEWAAEQESAVNRGT